ncbi:hypothetical protein C8R43DRAFT_940351 [Mycena crocata]|nr:hypothetical protein C8R43DRAFT_940351 [Mycena crocata]
MRFLTPLILLAAVLPPSIASALNASITAELDSRACGISGSLLCTAGSCCSGLFCSAQGNRFKLLQRHKRSLLFDWWAKWRAALLQFKQFPCCATGGQNGAQLYCSSSNFCTGCIPNNSFCDPLVPCCSGKCSGSCPLFSCGAGWVRVPSHFQHMLWPILLVLRHSGKILSCCQVAAFNVEGVILTSLRPKARCGGACGSTRADERLLGSPGADLCAPLKNGLSDFSCDSSTFHRLSIGSHSSSYSKVILKWLSGLAFNFARPAHRRDPSATPSIIHNQRVLSCALTETARHEILRAFFNNRSHPLRNGVPTQVKAASVKIPRQDRQYAGKPRGRLLALFSVFLELMYCRPLRPLSSSCRPPNCNHCLTSAKLPDQEPVIEGRSKMKRSVRIKPLHVGRRPASRI